MSCTDKITRWTALGLQGAILSRLVGAIYVDSIVVGELFEAKAMSRSLCDRVEGLILPSAIFSVNRPTILSTTNRFCHSKRQVKTAVAASLADSSSSSSSGDGGGGTPRTATSSAGAKQSIKISPAGTAINWSGGDELLPEKQRVEVTVLGRKQGFSAKKKAAPNPRARSRLCKAVLFHRFCLLSARVHSVVNPAAATSTDVVVGQGMGLRDGRGAVDLANTSYAAYKAQAIDYVWCKDALLAWPHFSGWVGNGNGHERFTLTKTM